MDILTHNEILVLQALILQNKLDFILDTVENGIDHIDDLNCLTILSNKLDMLLKKV